MKSIECLPPSIKQCYDEMLLSKRGPAFKDSCETLMRVLFYIKERMHKWERNPAMMANILELERQFMEIYEWAKAKEKERKGQKDHKTQVTFYYIGRIDSQGEAAFSRSLFRRKIHSIPNEFWTNDDI